MSFWKSLLIAEKQPGANKPLSLITWSAKTESSVNNYAHKLAGFVGRNKHIDIADIAYTLQNNRADFNTRRFIIAGDSEDLQAMLTNNANRPIYNQKTKYESIRNCVYVSGAGLAIC